MTLSTTTAGDSHHLPPSEFLTRLTNLFATTHSSTHGSVLLTQKPFPSPSQESPLSSPPSSILLRASNGLSKDYRLSHSKPSSKTTSKDVKGKEKPKIKISTLIPLEESEVFFAQYAEVCKRGMEGLRKRDRKAKAKAKAKSEKKKKGKKGKGGVGGGDA